MNIKVLEIQRDKKMPQEPSNTLSVALPSEVPKEDGRPKWDNKFQYLLTCIGFAVGLGNVWRFPYLCQTYGGGAFLIPYLIALVLEGIPLFHIELAIGQRLRKGSIGAWSTISPYLGGLGISSLLVSFLVGLYYNTILAWVLWYFFNSFQEPVPWNFCPVNDNRTGYIDECSKSTAVNYFWYRKTLNISSDIMDSGSVQWRLVLCLATAWAVVYICTIRGIESTGKAVYITATFPYLVLTLFLIRGLTLPGSVHGLIYLFTPNLNVLKNPRVWLDAATQIFFSLSLAFGGLIAFSSYNPPKNDCEKDAVIVAIINSLTSLYASIPIFSILGFKATTAYWDCLDRNIISITNEFDLMDQSITRDTYSSWYEKMNSTYPEQTSGLKLKDCNLQEFLDQSASGTGLAFIIFTEAIIRMPGSQVWAILFFVMLFALGLSSMFGTVEGVLTPLLDLHILPKALPKEFLSGLICLVSFIIALIFTMTNGNYWLEVFDSYAGSLTLLVVAFFEVIGVSYVYGIKRFSDDVKWMTGRYPNLYWQATWRVFSPLMMLIIFLSYIVIETQKQPSYEAWNPNFVNFPMKEKKLYPDWVLTICMLLVVIPCMFIPGVALYHFIRKLADKRRKCQAEPHINSVYENSVDEQACL
ncbi:LOW QUALITY PROTEIN: inactive sodium-dependent neutral amino acid transporter B(0)AT3 [Rhinatrema bivittatum]|uniref:LOW QUALITY PROTEIN: inactive sodium-dependent neutral amino acid transporter B(0)AT3 n=1 Tax=Rhinatrema bivittatum TaxID=194408 RepID=UPI00112A7B48|nr:LOW QUALITY PROTEIN: inactive sodium-dependent neutral amino acid transporter B(0)AT3 [Rhinatrema bivittatum]